MKSQYLKVWVDSLEKYRKLNDAEFGRLIRAALRYKAKGETVKLSGREEILLDGMITDIDRDTQTDSDLSVIRSENGRKGAMARWKIANDGNCHLPLANDSKDGQEEDKEKEEDQDKEGQGICALDRPAHTRRFIPPSVDDVFAYCRERNNSVDPQRFVNHYEANGWMRGKNKIKDWRACVRTWEQGENSTDTQQPGCKALPFAWMREGKVESG